MTVFNITDFGAKEGTPATEAIQKAIDLCPQGGTVLIPRGIFVSGALFLKSDMTLRLEEGARLLASADTDDFPIMGYSFEGREQLCYASLLNTDSAPHRNITIEGDGIIDAGGNFLFQAELDENKGKRGRAVCIRNTDTLTVTGVTIRNSPAWCLHLLYCRNVLLNNVKIHTKYAEDGSRYILRNGDGIDVDSCRDVHIANCLVSSQDDCIAIKSGRDEEGRRAGIPSRDILIEDCTFTSGFGIAIGSEMSGGVENVTVRNCVFENTSSLISLKTMRGRGGNIRNITYENCTHSNESMEYRDCQWFRGAIYIDGFYASKEFDPADKQPIGEGTPFADGITLRNITASTVSGNAVFICGLPEAPIRHLRLENVKVHGKSGMITHNLEDAEFINVRVTSDT